MQEALFLAGELMPKFSSGGGEEMKQVKSLFQNRRLSELSDETEEIFD